MLTIRTDLRTAMCLPQKPFWKSLVNVGQLLLRAQYARSELPHSILLQVLWE